MPDQFFLDMISYDYSLNIWCRKIFFKIGESVITTQGAFSAHFMLHRNDAVQNRKSILLCLENSIRYNIVLT